MTHVLGHQINNQNTKAGISYCSGIIPPDRKQRYEEFSNRKIDHNTKRKRVNEESMESVRNHVESGASLFRETKRLSRHPPTIITNGKTIPTMSDLTVCTLGVSPNTGIPRTWMQSTINRCTGTLDNLEASEKLDFAIADLIHAHCLPFSLIESPRLHNVLKLAMLVGNSYSPPSRGKVSGSLLDSNFENIQKEGKRKLISQANIFGLSILGDGATIQKMPLFNILSSGVGNPAHVLRVIDCTSFLKQGIGKSGTQIASLCQPSMDELDPEKRLIDLVLFDGAGNMVLGGKCLAQCFPLVTVVHGSEHVLALFCKDVLNLPPIRALVHKYKFLYSIFGNGSCHAPYALFMENCRQFNKNNSIGLIQAAETRMGGYWYCLHRMLRLQKALVATISSPKWADIVLTDRNGGDKDKNRMCKKKQIEELICNSSFFKEARVIVILLYEAIRALRLSDSNKSGMDKIRYYTRVTSRKIHSNVWRLDDEELFVDSEFQPGVRSVGIDNKRNNCEESDEEDNFDDIQDDFTKRPGHFDTMKLSHQVEWLWNKRKPALEHSYSVVGWLLSVQTEIYEDAKSFTKEDQEVLHDLAQKMFTAVRTDEDDNYISTMVNNCMEGFIFFRNKSNHYANPSIWESKYTQNGESHRWHELHTNPMFKELGYVACRVTSKLLGIGSAERAWGDVKQMKSDKRAHLSGRTAEKQSIIFGTACLSKARIKGNIMNPTSWNAADLDDVDLIKDLQQFETEANEEMYSSDSDTSEVLKNPGDRLFQSYAEMGKKPVFNAYIEDWEPCIMHKNSIVHMWRFKKKYANIRYVNPDDSPPTAYSVFGGDLKFWRPEIEPGKKKEKKRWCLYGVPKGIPAIVENVDKFDLVEINESFFDQVKLINQGNKLVVDKGGVAVNRLEFIKSFWPERSAELSREWDSYPSI